ncbi:MAG TPA: divalent metal cation transporter, partial [Roseiarcus sp.]|nr:divalent metal cation transporter [Roseiarcus sp.]
MRAQGRAMEAETQSSAVGAGLVRSLAVWGPGLLVMLADTDAGNVVTAAQAGAEWGYRLLPLVLLLIPMLAMVQELTVRLGLATGLGHGELIRARFGPGWAWLSTLGLAGAVIGSLITEFTGVAGVGELFGLSRSFTLPLAAAALLIIVASGSYKRVERTALIIGLFQLAFFIVAWAAHPGLKALARDAIDLPLRNRDFLFMAAAVIGATFNPCMIFYQQSATVD